MSNAKVEVAAGVSDKVLKRVDAAGQWASDTLGQLATKLGTTVDYLWPTYVRQVMAEGARLVGAGVLLIFLGVFAFAVLRKTVKNCDDKGTAECASFFSWALLMALVFIGSWVASSGVISIVAPEPEALHNIVSSIQSLSR